MAEHVQFTVGTDTQAYFCEQESMAARKRQEHRRPSSSALGEAG